MMRTFGTLLACSALFISGLIVGSLKNFFRILNCGWCDKEMFAFSWKRHVERCEGRHMPATTT